MIIRKPSITGKAKKETKVKETKKPTKEVTKVKKVPAVKKPAKIKYPDLKRGDSGDLVVQLQDFLSRKGSKVKVDGVFGAGTQSAVRAIQRKNGLKVTGAVDSKVWDLLIKK